MYPDWSINSHELNLDVQFSVGPDAFVEVLDTNTARHLRNDLLATLGKAFIDGSVWIQPIQGGLFGVSNV